MTLNSIKDFDPDYRVLFDDQDIRGLDLYSSDEKVGSVDDVLVDDEGRFRYLVINTGIWVFGKKVLLPIGCAQIDYTNQRVYANNLTKTQVENLPEFLDNMMLDYDYEEQVRKVYRPSQSDAPAAYGVGYSGADSAPDTVNTAPSLDLEVGYAGYDRDTYTYEHEPHLYDLHEQNDQNLKLYQERLIANKSRQKTGEVAIGKRVETETAKISVPVDKERVVIERTPGDSGTVISGGEANFQEGEVARMEVYEETPDIRKETFVREEVRVAKVVDHETVNAEERLRSEELDVDVEGRPNVEENM